MSSRPASARVVAALGDAIFESPSERLAEDVLAFVRAASLPTRLTLHLGLWFLRVAPILFFVALRPLERLDRARRVEVMERVEATPFGLALVGWRTLLMLHFYEDAAEVARIGYREERKRHLAVIPVPASSGVRLIEADLDDEHAANEKKGAA